MSPDEVSAYRLKTESECKNKSPEGCYYWASIKLRDTDYKDLKSVKPLFEIACVGNVMNSCTDLKTIELEGE